MVQIQFNKELNGIVVGSSIIQLHSESNGEVEVEGILSGSGNVILKDGDRELMATVKQLETVN